MVVCTLTARFFALSSRRRTQRKRVYIECAQGTVATLSITHVIVLIVCCFRVFSIHKTAQLKPSTIRTGTILSHTILLWCKPHAASRLFVSATTVDLVLLRVGFGFAMRAFVYVARAAAIACVRKRQPSCIHDKRRCSAGRRACTHRRLDHRRALLLGGEGTAARRRAPVFVCLWRVCVCVCTRSASRGRNYRHAGAGRDASAAHER